MRDHQPVPRGPKINHHALRDMLRARGLTQTELAGRVGVHPAHISRLCSGERPRPALSLTEAIASELDVPVWALLAPTLGEAELAAPEDRVTTMAVS